MNAQAWQAIHQACAASAANYAYNSVGGITDCGLKTGLYGRIRQAIYTSVEPLRHLVRSGQLTLAQREQAWQTCHNVDKLERELLEIEARHARRMRPTAPIEDT